jgi:hypothetical protein
MGVGRAAGAEGTTGWPGGRAVIAGATTGAVDVAGGFVVGITAGFVAGITVGAMGSVVCRLRSGLSSAAGVRPPAGPCASRLRDDGNCGSTGAGRMISYEPSAHAITSGSRSEASLPPTTVPMISPRR